MQALPQKTTNYVAAQFRAYFTRKARPRGMTYKEARAVVDYLSVAGPAPEPVDSGAIDYAKPRVSGSGGRRRPSQQEFEGILDKYIGDENNAFWDEVFDELIEQYKKHRNRKALRIVKLAFEQQLKREDICERLRISEKTYRSYRLAILTAAAIRAIQKGGTLDT